MGMGNQLIEAVAPYVLEAFTALMVALGAYLTAWLRARTQRLIVQQAADEVEAESHRDELLRGAAKRDRAIGLASERMSSVTLRPGAGRLERLVDDAVPRARRITPSDFPPPDTDEPET